MAKLMFGGMEFEGSPKELAEIAKILEAGGASVTSASNTGASSNGVQPNATWRWNDRAVDSVVNLSYGTSLKVMEAFAQHGRELKYKDLCRLTNMKGIKLVAPLSAISKKAKKAIGHHDARLIDSRWVIPGNRDERVYWIHPDAFDRMKQALKQKP